MTATPLHGAITLPDGSRVRGRGLRRPVPPGAAPDYGLYLGGARLRRRHDHELPWPHHWIDWPDFLLPRDRDHAVTLIRALRDHARDGERVEVACLAVLAGQAPAEAIIWTRRHYHPKAIETPWQRRWVLRFPPS